MTVRRRLVLLAAAAVAVAIALASVVTYAVVRGELRGQVDDALRALVPDVLVERAGRPVGGAVLERAAPRALLRRRLALPEDPLGGPTGVAQAVLADGTVLGARDESARLPVDGRVLAVARGERDRFLTDARVDDTHVRVLTAPGPAGGDALQIARPLTEVDDTLARLRLVLVLVSLGGIGLAAGLGLLVARGALRPVGRLTATAEHVAATQDLSRRLEVGAAGDELDRLGAAFNTMLAALESSRVAQRQLVADASHELRTPLTSVRANVEALGRARDLPAAERDRIVASARVQLEELTVLVGDLVDLARDEVPELEREDLRLDLVVDEAVRRARAHAPGNEIALSARATLVHGSRARLHRAVGNLLDNAVKWSPPGGRIEVTVAPGSVTVRDHGPGIAEADLPLVFDRFFRATDARGLPGSGLGLAIVRQAAEAHGGRASARNAPDGGAILELTLPELLSSS